MEFTMLILVTIIGGRTFTNTFNNFASFYHIAVDTIDRSNKNTQNCVRFILLLMWPQSSYASLL